MAGKPIKSCLYVAGILLLLFLAHSCHSPSGDNRYVSASGNDLNDGSRLRPFKTLVRATRESLKPGSRILLNGGDVFGGNVVLEGDSGEAGHPVVISSYGNGMATINGGDGNGMVLNKCKNLILSNLVISGSGRLTNKEGSGVVVSQSGYITLKDLETRGFQHAGVWIDGCDSVTVCRVHARENGFTGLGTDHRNQTTRVVFRECLAENNPGHPGITGNHSGSGILLATVKNGLVEFCEARFNGWDMPRLGNGPVGIWTWNSDSVVIQYCLSHHNKSPDMDGGGFDLDGGVTNSILQYNFSHHNAGAGYLVCQFGGAPRPLDGNHIRFNISLDDGLGCHQAGIMIYVGGEWFRENYFYHNTIVNTFHSALNFDGVPLYLMDPPKLHFYNNLFVSGKDQIMNLQLLPETELVGNHYWAYGDGGFSIGGYRSFSEWSQKTGYEKSGDTIVGEYGNPLINCDYSCLPLHPGQLRQLTLFKPLENSPLINHGVYLSGEMGVGDTTVDFFGKPFDKNDPFAGAGK